MRKLTLVVASALALGLCGCDAEALKGLLKLAPSPGAGAPPKAIFNDQDDGTNVVPPGFLYLAWAFPRTGADMLESPVDGTYPLKVDVSTYQESVGTRHWNRAIDYQVDATSSASGSVEPNGMAIGTTPGGLAISASLGTGTARVLLAIKPAIAQADLLGEPALLGHLPESTRIVQSADDWTALLDNLQASRSAWIPSDPGNDFASLRAQDVDFTARSVVAVMFARGYRESRPVLTHASNDRKTVNVVIPGFYGHNGNLEPGMVPNTVGYFFSLPKLPEEALVKLERLNQSPLNQM